MPGKLNRIRKYQWIKRMRTHGFRKRMETASGRNVLKRRRAKGRHRIVVAKSGR